MKKFSIVAAFLGASFLLSSCEVIGGIFKGGMAVGILLVVVVIALIFWLVRKIGGGGGKSAGTGGTP
jgi:hypothetical protein